MVIMYRCTLDIALRGLLLIDKRYTIAYKNKIAKS